MNANSKPLDQIKEKTKPSFIQSDLLKKILSKNLNLNQEINMLIMFKLLQIACVKLYMI